MLRSSTKVIQLIALAKTAHLNKYGVCPILEQIRHDISELENVRTNKNTSILHTYTYCLHNICLHNLLLFCIYECRRFHLWKFCNGISCLVYIKSCIYSKAVNFKTPEGDLTLCGTLVTVSADNLGSHFIGGFKGSCTTLRPCRHCMISYDEMKDVVCKQIY